MTDSRFPETPGSRSPGEDADAATRGVIRSLRSRPVPPAFRERLRADFVAGVVRPASAGASALPAASSGGRRSRVVRWFAVAAVLIGVFTAWGLRPSPVPWVVTHADGGVFFDGEPCPGDPDGAARLLRPGTRVEVGSGSALELVCPGMFALQIDPGSRLTVPGMAAPWRRGPLVFHMDQGILRITTGPEFAGSMVRIHAPDASVGLVGTTLAVLCSAEKTCVSVFEGRAEVTHADGRRDVVPAGTCRTVYHDPALDDDAVALPASERSALEQLRTRGLALLH